MSPLHKEQIEPYIGFRSTFNHLMSEVLSGTLSGTKPPIFLYILRGSPCPHGGTTRTRADDPRRRFPSFIGPPFFLDTHTDTPPVLSPSPKSCVSLGVRRGSRVPFVRKNINLLGSPRFPTDLLSLSLRRTSSSRPRFDGVDSTDQAHRRRI